MYSLKKMGSSEIDMENIITTTMEELTEEERKAYYDSPGYKYKPKSGKQFKMQTSIQTQVKLPEHTPNWWHN